MGDRGNIAIEQHDGKGGRVYLYTHWAGYRTPLTLQKALASSAGRSRWSDGPYLARIIFDAMTDGAHGEETGFGISSYLTDNEYPILVVDPDAAVVKVESDGRCSSSLAGRKWSFAEFCKLSLDGDEPWVTLGARAA